MQRIITLNAIIILLHFNFVGTTTILRRSLRIAQVAPMFENIPPMRSVTAGGASRNVQHLTEELVRRGHDVTLFAPYGSKTSAKLVSHPNLPAINKAEGQDKTLLPFAWQLEQIRKHANDFDIIHFHTIEHLNSIEAFVNKTVTTLYMSKFNLDEMALLFELFHNIPFVALTVDQQKHAPNRPNFIGQIYPGIPADQYEFVPKFDAKKQSSLAFLGRMEPEKGHKQAIKIAVEAGIPLKIATGQQSKEMEQYFQKEIKPLVVKHANLVEYLGEIKEQDKKDFLGNALALLILAKKEDDPFELTMIEAMSMGTPVIGLRAGPITEVVEPGVSGLIFNTLSEAVEKVKSVAKLSRPGVRKAFEKRWTVKHMADKYEQIYAKIFDENDRQNQIKKGTDQCTKKH